MEQALLVVNIGSSSLKFSLFAIKKTTLKLSLIFQGLISELNESPCFILKKAHGEIVEVKTELFKKPSKQKQELALSYLLSSLNRHAREYKIVAVGHRIVHGGENFFGPVKLNKSNIKILESLSPLAPLHQSHNISGVHTLIKLLPSVMQVGCFDTAFHYTQSALAQTFAIPKNISAYPIKRYGFHGLSYEYITQVLPTYLKKKNAKGKIIIAHLGHGASMCAIHNQKSVATTMGFSTLDGLPMGTRCGSIDPGVILYLLEQEKMSIKQITKLLYEKSGLLGVSGISSDVRKLLESDKREAKDAIELFVYRITREIGSLVAALNGLDSIVFTGGIGENSSAIREKVCQQLNWLGVKLLKKNNTQNNLKISANDSRISVWVIPANEELIIAEHTSRLWQNFI